MSAWRELVVDNPMKIEIHRAMRKFFLAGKTPAANSVMIGILSICYAVIFMMVARYADSIPPVSFVYVQAGVVTLIAPTMMYSSIAGEREKRSWDFLRVAPISDAQLVIGKYLAAVFAIGAVVAFSLPLMLITWISQKDINSAGLWIGELMAISFGLFATALTLFVSAKNQRSYVALGVSAGLILGGLALYPIVASMLFQGLHQEEWALFLHPFYALYRVYDTAAGQQLNSNYYGWPQILIYLLLAAWFLRWTISILTDVDRKVGGSAS